MPTDDSKRVSIRFEHAPGAPTVPATGVWGGASPNGSVVAQFFVERAENPVVLSLEASPLTGTREVGRTGMVSDDGTLKFVRVIQATLVVSARDAHSIGRWMIDHAKRAGFIAPPEPEKH